VIELGGGGPSQASGGFTPWHANARYKVSITAARHWGCSAILYDRDTKEGGGL